MTPRRQYFLYSLLKEAVGWHLVCVFFVT